MRIALVVPPGVSSSFHTKISPHFLGTATIAAVLEANGHQVRFFDPNADEMDWSAFEGAIANYGPDIIGISCDSNLRFEVFETARRLKRTLNIPIVVGGPHVSFTDADTLKSVQDIDFVVRGEGEHTMLELVHAVENNTDLTKIQGLSFRSEDRIIQNRPRPLIQNLDELPMPARHLLPLKKYKIVLEGSGIQCTGAVFSRGCPNVCTFCSESHIWGKRYRLRSAARVVDEIEDVTKTWKFDAIDFWDSSFNASTKWADAICDEIIRRRLNIKWYARIRATKATKALLEKMKKAGCAELGIGVESGSEKVLRTINKRITVDEVKRLARSAADLGFYSRFFFMVSLPSETHEDVEATLRLMDELESYSPRIMCPVQFTEIYPGTALEEMAYSNGCLPTAFSWAKPYYNDVSCKVGQNPSIPLFGHPADIEAILRVLQGKQRIGPGRHMNAFEKGVVHLSKVRSLDDLRVLARKVKGRILQNFDG